MASIGISDMVRFHEIDFAWLSVAKLAISIARKMNALIFLVPEDIVDVRPRLVSASYLLRTHSTETDCRRVHLADFDLRWQSDEHRSLNTH